MTIKRFIVLSSSQWKRAALEIPIAGLNHKKKTEIELVAAVF